MADKFDENLPYESCENLDSSDFISTAKFYVDFIVYVLKVTFFDIFELLLVLFKLVIPKTKKNIEGQVVLVTGGGNGIGKQFSIHFAKEKCKIAIVDIDFEAASKLAEEIRESFKVDAKAFKVDISKVEKVEKLRESIEESLGHVDILVNNAGILTTNISLFEGSHEDIQKIMDINLTSHLWMLRVFMKRMIENRRGHIVAVSSFLGKTSSPLSTVYCASKYGVTGLMDSLSSDLKFFNLDFIKTTTVFPFFVQTRQNLVDSLKGYRPSFTKPEELAEAVVDGVKKNERNIYFPALTRLLLIEKLFPNRVSLYARNNTPLINESDLEERRQKRLEEIMKALKLESIPDEENTNISEKIKNFFDF